MSRLKTMAYLLGHASYKGGDCLIWPYSRDDKGYGQVSAGKGKVRKAHRVMCEIANGPQPTPKHFACHTCGNGHKGCFAPNHLAWKTASENCQDRSRDGRWHSARKRNNWTRYGRLSIADAAKIINMSKTKSRYAVAREMGVSVPTVRMVVKGKTKTARAAVSMGLA